MAYIISTILFLSVVTVVYSTYRIVKYFNKGKKS